MDKITIYLVNYGFGDYKCQKSYKNSKTNVIQCP